MKIKATIDEGWIGECPHPASGVEPSEPPNTITTLSEPKQPILHYKQDGEWWVLYNKNRIGFRGI